MNADSQTPQRIRVFDLGVVPYEETQALQGELRRRIADGLLPPVLLLLEHPPVVTLGTRGTDGDLLDDLPPDLPLVRSERGGAATLHAPGQLVSYPIMPLPRRDLRAFVRALEETLIAVLRNYRIVARRREGRPGLYVSGDKIASVGLRCERWVASHGTSLNVALDLGLFDYIVSCAEPGLRQTDMSTLLGRKPDMENVKTRYVRHFAEKLALEVGPLQQGDLDTLRKLD